MALWQPTRREGGSAAPAESADGFSESFDLPADIIGVRLGLDGFVVGVDPNTGRPTGRPHDQRQLPDRDAATLGCDAIRGPGPGIVVFGHRSAAPSRGCSASGGTHIVMTADET